MNNRMTHKQFFRLLARANEIASQPGMNKRVTQVHAAVFAPAADVYCENHEAVAVTESKLAAANLALEKTFAAFDGCYRATRSVALAFHPALKVPETLKRQTTDTDKLIAVTTLVDLVTSHATEDWAKDELAGEFGSLSQTYTAELNLVITNARLLSTAKQTRATLYPEAYEKFLSFKQVVKDTLGASSPEYRRLKVPVRRGKKDEAEADEKAPTSGVKVHVEPQGADLGEIAKTG